MLITDFSTNNSSAVARIHISHSVVTHKHLLIFGINIKYIFCSHSIRKISPKIISWRSPNGGFKATIGAKVQRCQFHTRVVKRGWNKTSFAEFPSPAPNLFFPSNLKQSWLVISHSCNSGLKLIRSPFTNHSPSIHQHFTNHSQTIRQNWHVVQEFDLLAPRCVVPVLPPSDATTGVLLTPKMRRNFSTCRTRRTRRLGCLFYIILCCSHMFPL